MPISTPIICKTQAEWVLLVGTSIAQTGSTSTAPATIKTINFNAITATAGALSYDVKQSAPALMPEWTLTTDTPAICSISGNRVTKISAGTGIIRLTAPNGFFKTINLDFTGGSVTSYVWTGFSGTTDSLRLSDPILALLNSAKQKNIYSSYGVKNANCWAAPMDLTGSAIVTSLGGQFGTANSGALITPQHWVGVAHWGSGNDNMGPGATLTFVGSNGTAYTRTILRRDYNSAKDRIMCLLDSPLPATVKPFKLAGSSMLDTVNQRFLGMGWQITQEKNITPVGFDDFTPDFKSLYLTGAVKWESKFEKNTDAAHRLNGLSGLLQYGRTGDSGGAIGGYYGGDTYLVSLFTGPTSGFLYTAAQAPEINAIIAALDAAQGISTGYQVGVLEIVSGFDPLSLSPAMWLDASDTNTLYDATTGGALVAANGAVARWQDKSGNVRHATQATAGARPLRKDAILNGKSVLRFDGVDDGMAHTLGIVGDNTVFMVARSYQATSDSRTIFSATAPNTALNGTIREDSPSGQWGSFRVEGPRTSGQSLRGAYKIISSQSVGVNGSLTTNGSVTNFTSSGFYTDANARMSIGFNTFNTTEQCNCDIAEILVFPTALSSTDRAAVESYLNAKWAVY